ncbi:MAG: hypothetical protein SFW63_00050 [Alphaproteobacteria bacterium]|nr:hypothetical protein [Alphaproteobacteria bacterium]
MTTQHQVDALSAIYGEHVLICKGSGVAHPAWSQLPPEHLPKISVWLEDLTIPASWPVLVPLLVWLMIGHAGWPHHLFLRRDHQHVHCSRFAIWQAIIAHAPPR